MDEEALREGHINFVEANWEADPEDDNGDYEAVDGYTGEDVGWFMMCPSMLGTFLWEAVGVNTWRPPDVLYS